MTDWSAVPHPARWHERAAARRALLDAAVARLRASIAGNTDFGGALVLGSYATGHVGPESDLDVMVVTTMPAHGDLGARYARSCGGSISTCRAISSSTSRPSSSDSSSSGTSLPRHFARACGSMQQHPLELARNWFAQAERDLDAARYLADGLRYDLACFACQQAVAKALKGARALVWPASDRPRTHEILRSSENSLANGRVPPKRSGTSARSILFT